MIAVRRVVGESMLPALKPGRILVFWRFGKVTPGKVVIARVRGREIVKRVAWIRGNKAYLLGDNAAASTDSRQTGPVPVAAIKGVAVGRV